MSKPSAPQASPMLRLALDYGPLLIFFAVNFFVPASTCRRLVATVSHSLDAKNEMEALLLARVFVATAAFAVATLASVVISRIKLKHVSPILYLSAILVFVFGGLTWWFADRRFIQIKPTFVYGILTAILAFGLATGRPLLEQLLGAAYPGLTAIGWRKLTINWMFFFAALGVANEIARQVLSYDAWVVFKFPGCAIITLVFSIANIPMLMRHGLKLSDDSVVPPEG